MPETTENYHRIPVRAMSDFVDGSIKTITLSAGKHIKALSGKLRDGGSMAIKTYLFDVKFWSMAEAKQWVKGHETTQTSEGLWESVWSEDYRNSLPDSSFLWIEPGGDGKTLRHFPVKDASGRFDPDHVKNALAIIEQMDPTPPADVKEKLRRIAEQLRIGEQTTVKESIKESSSSILEGCLVDRENGFLRRIPLWSSESKSGHTYSKLAAGQIVKLLEGAKVVADHDRGGRDDERSVLDFLGIIRNAQLIEEAGGYKAFGDVKVNTGNKRIDLFSLAESVPEGVGSSIEVFGTIDRKRKHPLKPLVEEVSRLERVALVLKPATVKNLLEGVRDMKIDELTLESIREQRPDLVAKITEEVRESMGDENSIKEMEAKLKEKAAEVEALKESVDKYKAAESLREKQVATDKLIEEAKLPAETVTEVFKESLYKATTEEDVKKLIEDRKALVESVRKTRPRSSGRDVKESIEEPAVYTDETKIKEAVKDLANALR